MAERIFIGVAWPYANGPMHLGTLAGCILPSDIFARYHRMAGYDVLMVSGSDEHGTPITITAEKEGVSPQEIVDRYHEQHKESLKKLGVIFDNFTRTTKEFHKKVVQNIFLKLYQDGYIYKKSMEVPYCRTCKRFLPDRYIIGKCPYCDGNAKGDQCDSCGKTIGSNELVEQQCTICGGTPEIQETQHLFFKLSHFQHQLEEWLSHKDYWKPNVIHFSRNWIKEGLEDRAISRDMDWGVPIPLEEFSHQCIYVWFEAVMGYLSASMEWAQLLSDAEKWRDWWINDTKHYYFLAKDNIPFHSIIWPSILMGYGGLQLPYDIPANEYLTLSGEQFSKSKGIGIWLPDVLQKFDPDTIRYYLSVNMPEKHDTDWSWKDFAAKTNNELVDTYGNFVHRVLVFTHKNFGETPKKGDLHHEDQQVLHKIKKTVHAVSANIQSSHYKRGIRDCMDLAAYGNKYFNDMAPWRLIKENTERCKTVLHICLQIIKALTIITSPFMPHQATKVWKMMGNTDSIENHQWEDATIDLPENPIAPPIPLFKKIDITNLLQEDKHDVFSRCDLKIAKILTVKNHPLNETLYVLDIDLGTEKKEIVAEIKRWYTPKELQGKNVVVLTNINSMAIQGVVSQGMLLAAQGKKTVAILTGQGLLGARAHTNKIQSNPTESIDLKEFKKIKLTVDKKGRIIYKNQVLKIENEDIHTERPVEEGARVI